MYKVTEIPRKCLVSSDEVIAWGPTENSVDPRQILQSIQVAEERFIKPALGKFLYNDFREKKNVIVTEINQAFLEESFTPAVTLRVGQMVNALELVDNPWYVTLWNEYLWKLVAECVIYVATPTNYSRFTSSGETFNNPRSIAIDSEGSGAASVELRDIKWKMDKMLMDRIDPTMQSMHEFLCDNKGYFPLYTRKCDCGIDGTSFQRKTPWIHVYGNKNCADCDYDRY